MLFGVCVQRHIPPAFPEEKRPGTNFAGDWVDHRSGLGGFEKQVFELRTVQPTAIRYRLFRTDVLSSVHEILCGVIWRISYAWQRRNFQSFNTELMELLSK